ncbi:MAG: SAF domain-containing protein, partial [Erysipelotrichaceae bacterium]|nr:SAF domain-containing protein [Erysipelotrichaceae bacterium]
IIVSVLIIGLDVAGVHYYSRYLVGFEKVYVASHQLSQRTKISEEDLKEIEVPKGYVSEDVYTDINDILGKYVKLSYSIPKGSLIYRNAVEEDARDIEHSLLMNGQVTYDIYTSEAKVNSGSLSNSMYVDLYLTISSNSKTVSDLLLSDARIIGLFDSNEQAILDYNRDSRVYIISLAVDEKDVPYLNKAFVLGDIKIIVSSDTYKTNKRSSLNTDGLVFEYLQ